VHIVIALKQAGDKAGAYGPFPGREAATTWAAANLPTGTYRCAPLTQPDPTAEGAPVASQAAQQQDPPIPPGAEASGDDAGQPEATQGPPSAPASRPLKERIRIVPLHLLTSEEKEQAISVDFMESPLACLFDLRSKSGGHPVPRNHPETIAKYRAWLDERLAAKDERVRNVLNALYQALKRGHDLTLTTRGSVGRNGPAFEIKRRLIDAFSKPCRPCTTQAPTLVTLHPSEHVWSPELQTLVTDRYGLLPTTRVDPHASRPKFVPRYYVKQRGPRGKAFFENVPAKRPPTLLPSGPLEQNAAYQVTQG